MDASLFIGRRLRFKGKIVMASIAVSFLVMIIAVTVSSGFRHELRSGLASVTGDIQLIRPDMNYLDEGTPVDTDLSYMPVLNGMEQIDEVVPVICRAGIVKQEEDIYGVFIKGVPRGTVAQYDAVPDSLNLGVAVPSSFAEVSGCREGDRLLVYFIGDRMKVRQFNVAHVYEAGVDVDGRYMIYADIEDMRRLNGWSDGQASMLEIRLKPSYRGDEASISEAADEIGFVINSHETEEDDSLISISSASRYPQVFGWLDLIDFNVLFILLLMTVVAGFNMISGLLIMLFENISTIGLLKSVGMTDKAIAKVFLSTSSVLLLKGMAIGNALALLFCLIQDRTHILKLDPENYFVSFVPVHVDMGTILLADAIAFVVILALLTIPSLFISKVDPADTVRVK